MKWGCRGHWGHWGCWGHWGHRYSKAWKITTEHSRVFKYKPYLYISFSKTQIRKTLCPWTPCKELKIIVQLSLMRVEIKSQTGSIICTHTALLMHSVISFIFCQESIFTSYIFHTRSYHPRWLRKKSKKTLKISSFFPSHCSVFKTTLSNNSQQDKWHSNYNKIDYYNLWFDICMHFFFIGI